jgi:hypothetical protein
MCYSNIVMPQNTQTLEPGEGTYAHDFASGRIDPSAEVRDMNDGNAGFHSENLHDEAEGTDEATGRRRTNEVGEWDAAGVEVRTVDEADLAGDGLIKALEEDIDPDDPDAWMNVQVEDEEDDEDPDDPDAWLQKHDPTLN